MGNMIRKLRIRWAALFGTAACLMAVCPLGVRAAPRQMSSASAVLLEPESGRVLYEKDAHTPRPMASTTKIMTALLAVEHRPLDQEIVVTKEAIQVEGSSLGLRAGDHITVRDLVTGLLLESGNDAANVIAREVAGSLPAFAEMMNARAAELGMKDSTFVTPSGLDEGNHSSSAYDMALLAAEVMRNDTLADICAKKRATIQVGDPPHEATVVNHNKLLSLYPYAVGMKTGFTKKSGKCLVSAARKDGVLLIAVTLNGGDYWNDHMALYEDGFARTVAVKLPDPGEQRLSVAGGMTGYVQLRYDEPPTRTLLKEEAERVVTRVELPRFVLAPVVAGETVGQVRYLLDGRELARVPLTAAYKVDARPVAGYGARLLDWLGALLREMLY